MRKPLSILLLCLITTSAFGQLRQKPMHGEQVNWAHPLSKGLVLYLPLLEGSGNKVFDLSGNGNAGTFVGTAPSWTSGEFGSAVLLPGTDEYIDVSGLVNHISKAQGTLIIWCNFTTADLSDGNQHSMFEVGYSVDNDDLIALRKTAVDAIVMRHRKDDVVVNASIAAIGGLTGLHQYIGTWGGGEVKIYLDGILQDTQIINTITGPFNQSFIGESARQGNSAKYFDGMVESASAYNRVLSASEIALHYREPFCMFQKDDIAILEAAIPVAPGGQVITIQMTAIPLVLIIGFCLMRRKNGKTIEKIHR